MDLIKQQITEWLKGILIGNNGLIQPDDDLTRAEMATIIVRAFGASGQASLAGYTDVSSSAWYYADMAKAVYMKVFKGNNGRLNPDAFITRQETFVALAHALHLKDGTVSDLAAYTDGDTVADWAVGATAAMVKSGYVQGANENIAPKAKITRKDFAVLMDDLIKNYIKTAGTVTKITDGSVMINVPDVTLKNVTIKGNLIIGDGVGDGSVTLDNVKVEGTTIVRGGGVNSFVVKGSSTLGSIIIAKVNGNIRVYIDGAANVNVVEINDGKDDVLVEGTLAKLKIAASGVPVYIQNATVKDVILTSENEAITVAESATVTNITTQAANTKLTVAGLVNTVNTTAAATGAAISVFKGATVNTVNAAGTGAEITGDGTVTNTYVSADDATVNTVGTKLTVSSGVTGTTAGGKGIPAGTTTTTTGIATATTGGSGGGNSTISVTGITVKSKNDVARVVAGGTLQMCASVFPDNATNKTVTWSVDNTDLAEIDASGILTAKAAGTVTVTAAAVSGVEGTATVYIGEPVAVEAAVLHDQAGQINDNDLIKNYTASAVQYPDLNFTNVTVTGSELQYHQNSENTDGFWIGFAVKAPTGAAKYKYAFAATKEGASTLGELTDTETIDAENTNGITFYANLADSSPKRWCKVQWYDAQDKAIGDPANYYLDISGVTLAVKTNVILTSSTTLNNQLFVENGGSLAVDPDAENGEAALTVAAASGANLVVENGGTVDAAKIVYAPSISANGIYIIINKGGIYKNGDTVIFGADSTSVFQITTDNGYVFIKNSGMYLKSDAVLNHPYTVNYSTLTICNDQALIIPEGVTLAVNGTLINKGTITNNGIIENNGLITSTGTITNNGTIKNNFTLIIMEQDGQRGVYNGTGSISSSKDYAGENYLIFSPNTTIPSDQGFKTGSIYTWYWSAETNSGKWIPTVETLFLWAKAYSYSDSYVYAGTFELNNANIVYSAPPSALIKQGGEADTRVKMDLSHLFGALYRMDDGASVTKITYNGKEYTWNSDGESSGSNWESHGTELVSALVNDITTAYQTNPSDLGTLDLKINDMDVTLTCTITAVNAGV